jgi:phosphoglycerate kinase
MKMLRVLKLNGKFVLLRVDINSDVVGGKVIISERIKECVKTIRYLKEKKARVVVLAHQGNVGKSDFVGLGQHAKFISKFVKVRFVKDVVGEKAQKSIKSLKDGEVLLLDNVRFVDDEFNPDKKDNLLIKNLVPLFDFYVNDAFSVCHRNHTSIVGFPKYLESVCGLLLEKELNALKKVSMKGAVYILGGAKPESNVKLLKGNKVLSCGFFGQICLISKGKDLGFQNEFLKKEALVKGDYKELLKNIKKKLKNVEMPVDFAVRVNNKRKEFLLSEFPLGYQIDDIGERTIEKYIKIIKKVPAVYMKGPAGYASDKIFSKGTISLLRAVLESKAFSLVGGGHLSDAIYKYKLPVKRFNHISLSGGALLDYIAGEKLVGLKALGWYKSFKRNN